jgi:hypothetical protein
MKESTRKTKHRTAPKIHRQLIIMRWSHQSYGEIIPYLEVEDYSNFVEDSEVRRIRSLALPAIE